MTLQTHDVSEVVRIKVRKCQNRVTVIGGEDAQHVAVDYPAKQEGDAIMVEGADRVTLRVPRRAEIDIADCEADVRVEDLDGRVELAHIGGDVSLRNLRGEVFTRDLDGDLAARNVETLRGEGSWDGDVALHDVKSLKVEQVEGALTVNDVETAAVNTIEGDLNALNVHGSLTIDQVKGDVNLRETSGNVSLDQVEGDFIASGVRASLRVHAEGDAVVSFIEIAQTELRAEGDVVINLPNDANAEIELDAPQGHLVAHAELNVIEEDESHVRGTLGSGGVKFRAESGHGDLIMRAGGAARQHIHAAFGGEEFAEMGQRIAEEGRQSVRGFRVYAGPKINIKPKVKFKKRWGGHCFFDEEEQREEEEEKPRGPAAGSPERQAILDAIARGEMNVDDAIRKLRGE